MSATPPTPFSYQHVEYNSPGAIVHTEQHYHHSAATFLLDHTIVK